MTLKELSVADIEKMLAAKKSALARLERRREQLQKQLDQTIAKIAALEGSASSRSARKPTRAARPQNERTLKEVVTELLQQNKKGYGLDALSKKVLETGYRTSSTNFKNTLYQTLYNHGQIRLDKARGVYILDA